MSGNQIVSVVVAAATFAVTGNPQAAQFAFLATSAIGSIVNPEQIRGPRLEDLKVTSLEYGTPIPIVYGHPRVPGVVIWSSEKHEIATTEEAKGGPEVTNYTYTQDMLYMLCANEGAGVRRIWSNGKLIWTNASDATAESISASLETDAWEEIEFFDGNSAQMPWSLYEADVGVSNAPAYRGKLTVGITGLNLGSSGYAPNLTFEVTSTAGQTQIFEFTGADQTYVVPDGITTISAFMWGAGGAGAGVIGTPTDTGVRVGGGAGYAQVNIPVTPGESLTVIVGGGGQAGEVPAGAYGGGGSGDRSGDLGDNRHSGGGGGRSAIRRLTTELATAAGGGGAGNIGDGGVGGGAAGGEGQADVNGGTGQGGTQSAGGAGGIPSAGSNQAVGEAGIQFAGGDGDASTPPVDQANAAGGGGGGGYYGGGGGGASNIAGGGGGGGSSYVGALTGSTTSGSGQLPGNADSSLRIDTIGEGGEADTDGGNGLVIIVAGGDLACTPLDEVVIDLCVRSGLNESYIDASDLSGQEVCALAISQVTPARQVIEMLMRAYNFSATEGDQLKFVSRGGASVASPEFDALGAGEEPASERLPIVLRGDIETPSQVSVTYADLLNDYQNGTEYSDRIHTGATGVTAIQLPLGLNAQQAKQVAEISLLDAVLAKTQLGPVGLTKYWSELEPTDIVTFTDVGGSTDRTCIQKITDQGASRSVEVSLDDASIFSSEALADLTDNSSTIVRRIEPTVMELMDIAILRDADDDTGFYAAFSPETIGGVWSGATLYRELSVAATCNTNTVIGVCSSVLGDFAGGFVFDEISSVTVVANGALESYTRTQILNGTAPAYLIGDEIVYARTATLVGGTTYTLRGFLRGRRGTESYIGSHGASGEGEVFVRLQTNGLRRIGMENSNLGVEYDYRAVSSGRAFSTATPEAFTNTAVGKKPFAVVNIRSVDNGDGTFDITWSRRTRGSCRFTGASGINVPLFETAESYVVEVYNGTTLVNTQTVSAQAATVTAVATYSVVVYQFSSTYGNGYPAELTL